VALGSEKRPGGWFRTAARQHWPLLPLLVVGAVLRLRGLEQLSLWNDELSTWYRTEPVPLAEVWGRVVADRHPPGYYAVLAVVQRLFGGSETALRAPSAVFGLLTIVAVYVLGLRLGQRKMAILGALFATVSWDLIGYSQTARPYTLLTLCCVASAYWFYENGKRVLRGEFVPRRALVWHGLWSAATFYAHYVGVVFVGVGWCALFGLVAIRRAGYRVLAGLALAVLLYLPWFPWFIADVRQGGRRAPPVLPVSELFEALVVGVPLWVGLVGGVVALTAAVYQWRRQPPPRLAAIAVPSFLLAWIVLPALVMWVKSKGETGLWPARTLEPMVPAVLLLHAWGVSRLPAWDLTLRRRALPVLMVALACVLTFGLAQDRGLATRGLGPEQFREAARWVADRQRRAPQAPIVTLTWNPAYFDYYLERNGSGRRVTVNVMDASELVPTLKQSLARGLGTWFLVGHRGIPRSLWAELKSSGVRVKGVRLTRASAYLLSGRPQGEASAPHRHSAKAHLNASPEEEDESLGTDEDAPRQ